jgi:hypothetical protein
MKGLILCLLIPSSLFAQEWINGSAALDWVAQEEANNPELRQAADSLRQSGFVPLDPYVLRAAEGDILAWPWEDFDSDIATGIGLRRHPLGGRELTIFQTDRGGRVLVEQKQKQVPSKYPDKHPEPLVSSIQAVNFYGCTVGGCIIPAIVSILVSANVAAAPAAAATFFGVCTGIMLGCLQELLPPPPAPLLPVPESPGSVPRDVNGDVLPPYEEFGL